MKDLFTIGLTILDVYRSNPILAVIGSMAVIGFVGNIIKRRMRRSY